MDNYEKKYNEALMRADEAVQKGCLDKDMFDIIFPPEESEDERIRKKIIEIIRMVSGPDCDVYLSEEGQAECLAWLEKQKEQKQNPLEDYSRGYNDGYYHGVTDSEKKPAEKQDYSGLNDLERAIHRGFLCAGVENVPVTIIKETAQDCLAQMMPADWTDKDKRILDDISKLLITWNYKEMSRDYKQAIEKLIYKPHWKPSEEQMKIAPDTHTKRCNSKISIEEKPVDATREEIIGLSIMFYLDTHLKHENSVISGGKLKVTHSEAREWIRRQIDRIKEEDSVELEDEIVTRWKSLHNAGNDIPFDTFNGIARHFAQWQKEQMMDEWLKDRDGCFWDGVEEGKKAMKEQMMKEAVKWLVDDDYHDLTEKGRFILGSVGLGYNGYYIPYSDLLKLPKEDEK